MGGNDGSIVLSTQVDTGGLSKGISKINTIAKGAGKAAATVGAAVAAIGAAAGAAAVAITKMSVSAYADYEQLVGGVETLFKDSADKVIAYAENAFATAGVSANEYMSIVTSFSASLLQSLGGDTDAAADIANQALIDMSDNANKMGTSMEAIQTAYQGFAKQNYTMLDNLKLGYGGTKTEMERLLKDAQVLTGVKYDINNLADVYNAIHAIQENLGIAGTTAKEAEETISGSAQMMKSAWENVLAAISGGGDLDRAINNLVYSIQKYFENIVPVVERALQGIGTLIERVAPMLVQTVVKSLIQAIPSLINAVYQMILGLVGGIQQGISALFKGNAVKEIEKQTNEIKQSVKNQNALTEAVEETADAQKKSLAGFDELNILSSNTADNAESEAASTIASTGATPSISPQLSMEQPVGEMMSFENFFSNLIDSVILLITTTIPKIPAIIGKILPRITSAFTQLFIAFVDVAPTLVTALVDSLPTIVTAITQMIVVLVQKLPELINILVQELPTIISILTSTFPTLFPAIFTAIVDLISILAQNLDKIIQPIIDSIPETLIIITSTLVENLPTIISALINIIMAIVNALPQIIDGIISALPMVVEMLVTALLENLPLIILGLIKLVAGIVKALPSILGVLHKSTIAIFQGTWKAIKNVFGKVGEWVNEKIVKPVIGFFQKMWDGVKSGLKSFVNFFINKINGLIGIVESFINFFIKGINWLIEKINTISFDVPDWVPLIGGKKLGFDIPMVKEVSLGRIPRLAQGAVIPPNREFMAVLGDQKRGMNLEAPEDLIRQIVREESGGKNFTVKATGSMAQLIRLLSLEITEEQRRVSVF